MRPFVVFALAAFASSCSHTRTPYAVLSAPRDWNAHPAVVQIEQPSRLFAVSDIHGGYDRIVALLAGNHLIASAPPTPDAVKWTGGPAVFVVAGDFIDKGPSSLEVVDLLRALEQGAAATGGQVIVTLGNHEAEFLDDPSNDKATASNGIDTELHARGIDPLAIANGSDARGVWLRDRPFAVRVGRWFFSHAGDTHGRSVADLESALRNGITQHDYDDAEAIGGGSILESRGWYDADPSRPARDAAAVGARHIVFGHQPAALGPRGDIALAFGGALFRIDCGMSPDVDDSRGRIFSVRVDGNTDVAESLDPDGNARPLWRGAID